MKGISVIIPMYNAERFIKECLGTVSGQSCGDFEVIVVDDGSSDRGARMCREAASGDERIRLVCQKNAGVSAARNRGLDLAKGDYVFFLDSDDGIHPRLFEEMLKEVQTSRAELVFCGYSRVNADQMEAALEEGCRMYGRVRWERADAENAEEWFHIKYRDEMSGIGGKLIKRERIGDLRFEEGLARGEDTLFLYSLVSQGIRTAYLNRGWYYYRMHPDSATGSRVMRKGVDYFESSRRIRDGELRRGHPDFALAWERLLVVQMERTYGAYKDVRDRTSFQALRRKALEEAGRPLFGSLCLSEKLLFGLCFSCYPAFRSVNGMVPVLLKVKEEITMMKNQADTGILTFHCSNNYGAMLQAYGLRTFLRKNGRKAEIVRYEPVYMTGRHWWIPYAPIKGLKGRIWGLFNMWNGFMAHLRTKEDFAMQRKNMNYFRYRYVVDKRQRKFLTERGLKRLKYRNYVLGSDQIWNPDITCGLRKAYFGAFQNKYKERVVSYAASFGGSELASCHDREFGELLQHVDAVSVREEAAIPYVQKFCGHDVTAVLDPVFFLRNESWQRVERIPERAEKKGYIFVYVTEPNKAMSDYAKKLSEETGLPVTEVRAGQQGTDAGFYVDHTAGPAEFLGYIHHADYVVSNSFHAAAFCIIYEKQFLAFVHSNLGARLRNIIEIHGLQDRLCDENEISDINASVDWSEVRRRTREYVKASGEFLLKNIEK